MKKSNQNGFGAVGTLLILVVVAVIGFAGWYVYSKKQDKQSNIPVSTTQSSDSSKSNQTSAPGGQAITLDSLGVKFTPPSDIGTLIYKAGANSDNTKYVVFSTKELTELKDMDGNNFCNNADHTTGASMHLGYLFKIDGTYPANPTDENTSGMLIKQFNGYSLQFRPPADNCFKDEQKQARATALDQELINSLKSTVEETN